MPGSHQWAPTYMGLREGQRVGQRRSTGKDVVPPFTPWMPDHYTFPELRGKPRTNRGKEKTVEESRTRLKDIVKDLLGQLEIQEIIRRS